MAAQDIPHPLPAPSSPVLLKSNHFLFSFEQAGGSTELRLERKGNGGFTTAELIQLEIKALQAPMPISLLQGWCT